MNLEQRTRQLEDLLLHRAVANRFGEQGRLLQQDQVPGAVSGLRVVAGAANKTTIDVEWSPSSIANLLYYDVEFSLSSEFTDATQLRTSHTRISLESGFGQQYFVRVRAVGITGGARVVGPWSTTLSTATSLAATADLAVGAASNLVIAVHNFEGLPGGYLEIAFDNVGADAQVFTSVLGGAPIETIGGTLVDVIYSVRLGLGGLANVDSIRIEALRNGEQIYDTGTSNFPSSITQEWRTWTAFTFIDAPPAGNMLYELRISSSSGVGARPPDFLVRIVEIKAWVREARR